MRLTDVAIRSLSKPERGQKTYTDDSLPGFGIRVSQGGTKTFVVVAGTTRERISIGRYPVISLAEARAEAKRVMAEITLGRHRPKTISFDEAKAKFISLAEQKNRPSTVRDYKRLFARHFPFGKTHVSDITRQSVRKKLEKLAATPSEQKHALVAIKTLFRWCVGEGYLLHSPCEAMKAPYSAVSRDRVLNLAEMREFFPKAMEEPYPFGSIACLIALTGQRRGEIAALEWEWIDRSHRTITLPASATKNKRKHTFPYGEMVARIFDSVPVFDGSPYLFPAARTNVRGRPTKVFNGWGKAKDLLDAKLENVDHYTLHDLRRTFATNMAVLGVQQVVVEKLLNHVSGGSQSPIAQVYNRYNYLDEMRDAVQVYENWLRSEVLGG